ncbi:MAG: hypothetical protein PUC65_10345 [Clostridiales bacterium]|nr:hypothetical protein [Clostridiales bacterium]
MDTQRFMQVCSIITDQNIERNGIGTLSEKTIHAVLKLYFSPDTSYHEQKVHNYVADILMNDQIIEVQTRNFNNLRRKLDAFLPDHKVTIVYPVTHTKWLCWVDEQTGEVSKPRKSPKKGSPATIFKELYRIKDYLNHPNLSLHIMLLDVEEYRLLNGWSKDRKKGSSRNDGIPVNLASEVIIRETSDYAQLIPDDLPTHFTTKDYKKSAHVSQGLAWTALNILSHVNAIKQIGKQGNSHVFERII